MIALRVLSLCALVISFSGAIALGRVIEGTYHGWEEAGSLAAPRAHLNAALLHGGDILVFGGLDPARAGFVLRDAEIIDSRNGVRHVIGGELTPRIDASATVMRDGRVLVAGGSEWLGSDWGQVGEVESFDPRSELWSQLPPMSQPRADHGAVVLRDGRVLVTGGHRGTKILASTEIFDPATGVWAAASDMPAPRLQFSIATLPNGDVLIAGGLENGVPSSSSVLYDPIKDRWRAGPRLAVPRVLHATVALPNGDVLMIGGQKAAAGDAQRYDARSGAFVYAGTLTGARVLAQAVALSDGRVLVAGGLEPFASRFAPTPSVEVWDAATNRWSKAPAVEEASAFGALVAIQNSVWLIAGSGEDERALSRVERYRVP